MVNSIGNLFLCDTNKFKRMLGLEQKLQSDVLRWNEIPKSTQENI